VREGHRRLGGRRARLGHHGSGVLTPPPHRNQAFTVRGTHTTRRVRSGLDIFVAVGEDIDWPSTAENERQGNVPVGVDSNVPGPASQVPDPASGTFLTAEVVTGPVPHRGAGPVPVLRADGPSQPGAPGSGPASDAGARVGSAPNRIAAVMDMDRLTAQDLMNLRPDDLGWPMDIGASTPARWSDDGPGAVVGPVVIASPAVASGRTARPPNLQSAVRAGWP
jgi:hypothetical protein